MSQRPTKVPGIGPPPASADPQTKQHLESLTEAVEIRLGRKGDPQDRAVTVRELIESGLAMGTGSFGWNLNNPVRGNLGFIPGNGRDLSTPPQPTGFAATGAYSEIIVTWDYPNYSNHSLTEIWSHDSDVLGDATLAGIDTGRVFIDPVGSDASRYYWIRHVSTSDVKGPWNSSSGTLASTSPDVDHLLNVLTDAITSSELATELSDPIGNLPADTSTALSNMQSQINTLSNVGAWTSGTAYAVTNLVTFSGSLYECATAHTASSSNQPSGTTSSNTYWTYVGAFTSLASAVAGNTSNITDINYISASSGSAAAQKIASLDATVTHPTTGVTATANAVSGLDTRVTTAENTITSQSTDITALETTVNDANTGVSATASAVSSLESTVSSQGSTLTSVSQDVTSLNTTVGSNSSSITTQASSINGLEAKYVVKTDVNGAVAGFGLASTANGAGNITSEFIVNADRFAIMRGGSNSTAATVPFTVQTTATTINGESVPAGVYMSDAFIKNGSIASAKIGSLSGGKITANSIEGDRIRGNTVEASKLKLDNNYLTEASNGDLILQTGNATRGVKYENLSHDAVGVIAMTTQSGSLPMSNQSFHPSNFMQQQPWHQYTRTDDYGDTSDTYTLPRLFQFVLPASKLNETGTYFLDFGADPFGSIPTNSSNSSSVVILNKSYKYPWQSSYTFSQSHATASSYYSFLPLTQRSAVTTTGLNKSFDYKFELYGHILGFNNSSIGSATKGMGGGYLRIIRIHTKT